MLKRLQIRNFRGFSDLTIDQLSDINLVAGKNNSGKTGLLEAIFMLASAGNTEVVLDANVMRGFESNVVQATSRRLPLSLLPRLNRDDSIHNRHINQRPRSLTTARPHPESPQASETRQAERSPRISYAQTSPATDERYSC